nr:MAG TPA: hypothetical protein [Siphoviridae sp. ctewe10]
MFNLHSFILFDIKHILCTSLKCLKYTTIIIKKQ